MTRYEAHLQSLKLEEKQRSAIDMKIDQMIEQESSLSNYSWLNEASWGVVCAHVLFVCWEGGGCV